jgi:EPS-associated MarR family transcriptional regulator
LSDSKSINLECEEVLKLLREIKKAPEMTQRELSSTLGISLGKVNFLIKALVHKGYIKANNFKNSNNKAAYFYLLTPRGLEEKARITYRFLVKKTQEYERLKEEIQVLEKEIGSIGISDNIANK